MKRRIFHRILLVFAALALYTAAVILPYAPQPGITQETVSDFASRDFYGEGDSNQRAKVISHNGEALAERIRLISQAKQEIILSTFDFDADNSGKMLLAALSDAAKRGVSVKILVDGIAHTMGIWGNPYFLALTEMEQVEFKVYNPVRLWMPWTLMGRLHDKYLIADDSVYILGGRNCYDFFLGDHDGYQNYDWDVLVYSAPSQEKKEDSLDQVRDYFLDLWSSSLCKPRGKSPLFQNHKAVLDCRRELASLYEEMKVSHPHWFEKIDYTTITVPTRNIQLISNPVQTGPKEPVAYYAITELMKEARESVYFHTPYIICNDWMTDRLAMICESVPLVQMMTNSVANNGNPFGSMDYQKNKEKILATGVKILEYDEGVSYHGKCFTIDNRLSAIGSFNWDMRSAYLDTELMLVIDSQELNTQLRDAMAVYEDHALTVTGADTYDLSEGQTPQPLSEGKKKRNQFLEFAGSWIRFLM